MKYLIFFILLLTTSQANLLDTIKEKTKNLGKQTPIDVVLYAKNPSHICTLRIANVSNPYKRDLTRSKLPPVALEPGRYERREVPHLLKGAYEFEYTWEKEGGFVDSRLKTVHIFAYHDTRNKVHKKVDLSFLLRAP